MNAEALELRPDTWVGLHEWPIEPASWGASPVYLTEVSPLKTGKAVLRLVFVHAFRPGGAIRRMIKVKVVSRTPEYLVGVDENPIGPKRTFIFSTVDFAWLEASCPRVWDRVRRRETAGFQSGHKDPAEYLAVVFGRDAREALNGALPASFAGRMPEMPAAHALLTVDVTLPPVESWFVSRGFVPRDMEEKWFVYMDEGRLVLRRSWTGRVIYDVEATWRGDCIHLGQARVNRDPEQYGETDDAYDRTMLLWLVEVVLLRQPAPFPVKAADGDDAPLKAWAAAGGASVS